MIVDVPDLVRQRAVSSGAVGRQWLAALPDVVAALATRWGLTIGHPYRGGSASYVVSATESSGRECVLKVAMPLDAEDVNEFRRSVLVHQLVAGRGCAALFDVDHASPALLLQRLGPNLDELGYLVPKILEVVSNTLRSFWRPVVDGSGLPTGADKAAWLADDIVTTWNQLGRPCSREVVERAVAFCDDRAAAFDPAGAVLVHGDAHGWNTLSDGDGQFKFVDPEGVLSERAHDLGVPMREYNDPLLAGDTRRLTRQRAEMLASSCDVDPESVWQWGFIERVSTGLANARDFGRDAGVPFFEVAERCL